MRFHRILYLALVLLLLGFPLAGCGDTAPGPDSAAVAVVPTDAPASEPMAPPTATPASTPTPDPYTLSGDTEWRYTAEVPEPISAAAGDDAAIAANVAAAGIRVQEGETLLGTRGPQLVLGDLDLHGVEVVIPAGALPDAAEVTLLTPERVPYVVSSAFAPVGAPIVISAGDAPVRLDEPVTIRFRLDADALAGVEDSRTFWAAYFDGERWQYLWADEVDLEAGVLRFTTYHFSFFGRGRISVEERLEQYTHNAALASYAQEQLDERLNEAAGNIVKHVLKENLGIDDESVQAQVIASLVSDDEWGDLIDRARDGDMVMFNQHLQVLTGKAIVMAVPESVLSKSLGHLVSDVGVGTVTAAAQAAGYLAEGRAYDAARIIGEHIADQFVITTAGRIAVAAVQYQMDSWKNSEIEAAYQAYKNGAESRFWGYSVDAGDFDALWLQMRGIARQLAIDAIRKQNEIRRDAGYDPLTPEEENALRARVREDLRRQFERRQAEEEAVERHRQEISALVELYDENGFLTEGRWGWTGAYGLEQRLDVLLHFKNRVMRDVKATTLVDGYSLHDGQLGRGAIIRATIAWYDGGEKAYAQYLRETFGISLYPEPQELAGEWQGERTIDEVRVAELLALLAELSEDEAAAVGEGETATEDADQDLGLGLGAAVAEGIMDSALAGAGEGCDEMLVQLKEMEGQTVPMPVALEAGEEGGTFIMDAEDDEVAPCPYTYSAGRLAMDCPVEGAFSVNGQSATRLVQEARVREVDGELRMTGTWSLVIDFGPDVGEFVFMRGTWQANK